MKEIDEQHVQTDFNMKVICVDLITKMLDLVSEMREQHHTEQQVVTNRYLLEENSTLESGLLTFVEVNNVRSQREDLKHD